MELGSPNDARKRWGSRGQVYHERTAFAEEQRSKDKELVRNKPCSTVKVDGSPDRCSSGPR
jgi:hypothetical protein